MAADDGNEKKPGSFWLYIGLGISGLLTIGSLASIADGFVAWTKFFREFIDAYRWAIRDPLDYVGNAIWPFGPIPGWVFDIFVLWSVLFMALNIFWLRSNGELVFSGIRGVYREYGFGLASLVALHLILFPITLVAAYVEGRAGAATRGVLRNFAFIFGLFILILLVNWQIKKIA
ncbi:MAG: hypothetical protein WAN43_15620 [Rhodomicrobium sp.]|jgi:hypothetical protein